MTPLSTLPPTTALRARIIINEFKSLKANPLHPIEKEIFICDPRRIIGEIPLGNSSDTIQIHRHEHCLEICIAFQNQEKFQAIPKMITKENPEHHYKNTRQIDTRSFRYTITNIPSIARAKEIVDSTKNAITFSGGQKSK